jgi:hypothetical protein
VVTHFIKALQQIRELGITILLKSNIHIARLLTDKVLSLNEFISKAAPRRFWKTRAVKLVGR